jgi:predicted DNA-binding protein
MTTPSTTIRVSLEQRERLRSLAERRGASMSATLDDALEALRRADFYAKMAAAELELRSDPIGWAEYLAERDAWLEPDLASP